jgi:hexosaminidase
MLTLHLRPRPILLLKQILSALFAILISLQFSGCQEAETHPWVIVPQPNTITLEAGSFNFGAGINYQPHPKALDGVLRSFQSQLSELGVTAGTDASPEVILRLSDQETMGVEAYQLDISPNSLVVTAATAKGAFYALTTIRQQLELSGTMQLPVGRVVDSPRFAHRGFMLDESRHFFGKEKVYQLLDLMAGLKLNTFHWHLTDDPGWRLAITAFPKLATIGGLGNHTNPDAPAQYYSQEEIKAIVRYAADRFITIIPEIDMPGHARAANRAYPQFSGGGSEKHPDFTFHPGKEATYGHLTTILREVAALFPDEYIHIGGDEVHFGNEQWANNKEVSALMAREGLNDLVDVEHYFLRRMADSLATMNRRLAGWDEVIASGIPNEEALVFWWRHDKKDQLDRALSQGFNTILCPRRPLYFDFVQHEDHKNGRRWDGFAPIEDVYGYPDNIHQFSADELALIQGIQANLWTERIPNNDWVDFMTFPRLFALGEAAWTQETNKDLANFKGRLPALFTFIDKKGVGYFNNLHPEQSPEPSY